MDKKMSIFFVAISRNCLANWHQDSMGICQIAKFGVNDWEDTHNKTV
jgi:hypothetical protein